jgi:hypothetical protein
MKAGSRAVMSWPLKDAALARVDDARDGLEDGGLARAVAAQHGGDLALRTFRLTPRMALMGP